MQGKTHIEEPAAGNLSPLPAVRGQGSRRDLGKSRMQLGQLEGTTELSG